MPIVESALITLSSKHRISKDINDIKKKGTLILSQCQLNNLKICDKFSL